MTSRKHLRQDLGTDCLAAICLLVAALAFLGKPGRLDVPARAAEDSEQGHAGSRKRLHELLTERYQLRKHIVESLEPFVNAGRVDIAELRDATVAMHRAEADLCATVAERVTVYEKMVDVLRRHERHAANRADAGRISEAELIEAKVATVEAQIELERLRLARQASP